jgi:tetratricopeptide (TPR) repeat protein
MNRLDHPWGAAVAQGNLGGVFLRLGRHRKALECYECASEYFRGYGSDLETRRRLAMMLSNLGLVCMNLGQLERALDVHREALTIQRETGDRAGELSSLLHLAHGHARVGLRGAARDGYERSALLAARQGDRRLRADALAGLGRLRLVDGDTGAALDLLQQAMKEARAAHDVEASSRVILGLVEAQLQAGKATDAARTLDALRDRESADVPDDTAAAAAHLRGCMEAALGRRKEAETGFTESLRLLRIKPDPELRWRVLRDLASLLTWDPATLAEAQKLRRRARALLRRLERSLRDPRLRRAYASHPERASLLAARDSAISREVTRAVEEHESPEAQDSEA